MKGKKVPWQRLIWFPLHVPKHSLIAWMAILNRQPTRDRLVACGLNIDSSCLLCSSATETRDHICFDREFSRRLWGLTLVLFGIRRSIGTWVQELNWAMAYLKGNSLIVRILKPVWTALIHIIWCERNGRLFGKPSNPVEVLLSRIQEVVRIRLNGKQINRMDTINQQFCLNRGLSSIGIYSFVFFYRLCIISC
ncbi:hypothetical protein PVK06_013590 [Gossypium arboreum]|uniref:Reverse transcriptase zinc-binding domain-containing protein n=1 Tax=Gossypium arboreum TaxID=29729 RepID=A0ABR0PS46_GOSAR|nr:hypothetical protein PVK06_013590 [Gossypium arboreum]